MSCVCEPCKKIIRIKCGAEPYLAENVCQYPDEYMLDLELDMSSACNCLVEHGIFTQSGYIKCCDRRQRMIDTVNGTYLLEKVVLPVGTDPNILAGYRYTNGSSDPYLGIEMTFTIYKASAVFPCGEICNASIYFPSYTLPCIYTTDSSKFADTGGMSLLYKGYQLPDTCNSPFTLQYEGFANIFAIPGPCLVIPPTITFTPVLGA